MDPAGLLAGMLLVGSGVATAGCEDALQDAWLQWLTKPSVERRDDEGVAMGLLGRLTLTVSQFANTHGVYMGRRSTRVHVALYRRSGGRVGGHLPGFPGARIALVDHRGARTGQWRTSPLIYHEQGGVVAVVASKAGQPKHPGWYHNLRANPDTTIQVGSDVRPVRARVASPDERDLLWPEFATMYPGYDFFQRLAKDRTIPIMILEPRAGEPAGEDRDH